MTACFAGCGEEAAEQRSEGNGAEALHPAQRVAADEQGHPDPGEHAQGDVRALPGRAALVARQRSAAAPARTQTQGQPPALPAAVEARAGQYLGVVRAKQLS